MRKFVYLPLAVAAMAAPHVSAQPPTLTKGHVQELIFDAASAGPTDMIDTMVKAGAKASIANDKGCTAASVARDQGNDAAAASVTD